MRHAVFQNDSTTDTFDFAVICKSLSPFSFPFSFFQNHSTCTSPKEAFDFTESFSLNFVFCRTQDVFLFDEIEAEGSELKLSVFDHNGLSKDELIGEVVLR
jgi:hypothetical protein